MVICIERVSNLQCYSTQKMVPSCTRVGGSEVESIEMAEDRELFTEAMQRIGLNVPHGGFAESLEDAYRIVDEIGEPH